jgi:hypothetical protein
MKLRSLAETFESNQPEQPIPYATKRALEMSGQELPKPLGIETGGSFDPRTEVSADARYISGRIVLHLWVVVVLLPVALGIVYAMVK